MKGLWIVSEGFDTTLAEGVIVLTPYSADDASDLNQAFVASYQAKTGEIPNQFAADAYDCIYAIYQAVVQAGVKEGDKHEDVCDKLVTAITSMTFDGLTGKNTTWAPGGAVSKSPNAVVIENGAYVGL